MWKYLKGEEFGGVNPISLRTFLYAILGLQEFSDRLKDNKALCGYDETQTFCVSELGQKYMQGQFHMMIRNRSDFINESKRKRSSKSTITQTRPSLTINQS
jgi:hypothetical protein